MGLLSEATRIRAAGAARNRGERCERLIRLFIYLRRPSISVWLMPPNRWMHNERMEIFNLSFSSNSNDGEHWIFCNPFPSISTFCKKDKLQKLCSSKTNVGPNEKVKKTYRSTLANMHIFKNSWSFTSNYCKTERRQKLIIIKSYVCKHTNIRN